MGGGPAISRLEMAVTAAIGCLRARVFEAPLQPSRPLSITADDLLVCRQKDGPAILGVDDSCDRKAVAEDGGLGGASRYGRGWFGGVGKPWQSDLVIGLPASPF